MLNNYATVKQTVNVKHTWITSLSSSLGACYLLKFIRGPCCLRSGDLSSRLMAIFLLFFYKVNLYHRFLELLKLDSSAL